MREILKLYGRQKWVDKKKMSEEFWRKKYLSHTEGGML